MEAAAALDDAWPGPHGTDLRQPTQNAILRDTFGDQAIRGLDAVEERQDVRSSVGQAPSHRSDLRQRVVFDGDDGAIDGAELLRVVGRLDRGRECLVRRTDLETAPSDRVEVSPPGQKDDSMTGPGEHAAIVAADSACPEDCNPHRHRASIADRGPSGKAQPRDRRTVISPNFWKPASSTLSITWESCS